MRRTQALIGAALLSCSVAVEREPSINVSLKTSFNAAPYLTELLETAALENATSYFPLLDRIADGTFVKLTTEKDLYTRFLDVLQEDGHISSAEALSSFQFALSLHAAAPRIEAHFQYYKTFVEPKMMAAQDAACPVWVHLDGQQYCSPALERAQQPVDHDDSKQVLPFDHILGDASDAVPSILYADISHPLFGQFHETVSRTAKEGKSSYRVRYRPSSDKSKPLYVTGYGTELVLKRTDYIVIDDRDATKEGDGSTSESQFEEKTPDFKPLTTSELSRLGLSAASYIMSSDDSFNTLIDVTTNFPKHSSKIAEHNYTENFLKEHLKNRDILLPAGFNVMWLNGLQVEQRQINAYSLLETLRRERRLIGQLTGIGLTPSESIELLSHESLTKSLTGDEPQRYDWRDDEEGGEVIIWMNDIENDKRYADWPTTLNMLLQRTFPGQLPQVRRNIHNLVVPVDLDKIKDWQVVVNALQSLVKRQIPIRIGLVPSGDSKQANEAAKLSYHIHDTYGINGLVAFYENVVESKKGLSGIQSIFEETIKTREPKEDRTEVTYPEILSSKELDEKIVSLKMYLARLALGGAAAPVLINGVASPRDEAWFDKISSRIFTDHRNLQVSVYEEAITDDAYVPQVFLDVAAPRRNTLIIPNDPKDINITSIADLGLDFQESLDSLPRFAGGESTLLSEQAHIIVLTDVCQPSGRALLNAVSVFHDKHSETEVLVLHNPAPDAQTCASAVKLDQARQKQSVLDRNSLLLSQESDDLATLVSEDQQNAEQYWSLQRKLVLGLGLGPGQDGVVLNGRVLDLTGHDIGLEELETLFAYERERRIIPVTTAITSLGLEEKFTGAVDLAKITSIVARSLVPDVPEGLFETPPPVRLNAYKKWAVEHTLIHVPSKIEASVQVVAVLDPASETVQPWLPILKTLSELEGVDIKIFLNPKNKVEELPIKRFYSQVISSAPKFDDEGSLITPKASFTHIPKDTLFNLGMIVPPSWLVAPDESRYDLDNIKLSSVPAGQDVDATYKLEHILIEGHARDMPKGSPPRGVQLLLGSGEDGGNHHTDTIIMANLGYFQFKANPGYYHLSLKPGRSSKIFTIDSVGAQGYHPQPGDATDAVALLSFQGITLYPRLSRKPGMEDEDVLESATAGGSTLDKLGQGASSAFSALSSFGLGGKSKSKNADINIFSVASGHLYERMLNIMMISVMRHTERSVKFWFIEQFLSPSFKAQLPILASHYGFDFEMVTYKWPHWLRGQKEKQREIWGYKILFLDVLFPLDLDKVIFVDADQIVRTDMMNLNNVDLQGAPYGFTPMCDSRTEMEGFRFWKQGYWEKFLNGKPYHISALYVVDLKKFRALAAGDRLRQQYHSLSADPGSLSNLDQDLPNHMQHVLPIHSLSQEWLWCETWCSDEALADAKTIDLCNNPQTKEPKLDRARRQVPEWTEYDTEIAQVLRDAVAGAAIGTTKTNNDNENDDDDDGSGRRAGDLGIDTGVLGDGGVQEEEQRRLQDEVVRQQRQKDEL